MIIIQVVVMSLFIPYEIYRQNIGTFGDGFYIYKMVQACACVFVTIIYGREQADTHIGRWKT